MCRLAYGSRGGFRSPARAEVRCMATGAAAPGIVYVYHGEGAGYRSAKTARSSVQQYLAPGNEARYLSTAELLEGHWRDTCLLLVMPGGADLPYCKHLNGRGNQLIKDYVRSGGAYLGICAGAYYACSRVEFEPGSPLEVVGDRELGFFPGTARGAAYPGFDYLSERGATAAPLAFKAPLQAMAEALTAGATASAPDPVGRSVGVELPAGRAAERAAAGASHGATCTAPGTPVPAPAAWAAAAAAAAAAASTACIEAANAPAPRLQLAHLTLPATHSDRSSSGGSDADDDQVEADTHPQRDNSTASSAEPHGPPDAARGWSFGRDYSNGGPVFTLPQPASQGAALPATTAEHQQYQPSAGQADPGQPRSATNGTHQHGAQHGQPQEEDQAQAPAAEATGTRGSSGSGGGGCRFDTAAAAEAARQVEAAAAEAAAAGGPASGSGLGPGQGPVEVLAVYPQLDNAAAALRCRVGEGVAVLCGTHPELPHDCVEAALELIHSREEQQHMKRLAGELRVWGRQRQAFWLALLLACCREYPGAEGVVHAGASG